MSQLLPLMRQIRTEVLTIATMRWWCLVQVGEERMLYLLSYAAIFVPLPNYCLLQVAGHSFSMATSNTKQIPKTISTTRKSQYELPTVLQQEDPTNEQNTSFETNMKTRLTVRENDDASIQCLVDSIACQPQIYAVIRPDR